ncbi:MAG: methyltransferase domain-containing protein [Candidatus Eisenbacteria bacterium]|uniref:Methyltransferase domain-containing protein n=1 Tax=Eiseniibacteriota bacterium TaxID=2212470 RepID=A0A538TR39_UNCEI|nr:MAG: methyltransferase domain-containing protein [Candidatus Eisenbacteria bacterium]
MKPPLGGARWVRQVRRDWNRAATAWERWETQVLHSLAAVDPALLRALALRPGQRVLDFGCGSGEPALAIAELVLPRGSVLGIDIAQPMLAIARRRARLRGIRNVRFRRGDIARGLAGRFDRAVSRYGLMFVEDVPLALTRVRRCLMPGGRLALAVWGPLARNPLFQVRAEAVRPFLKEPPPDPERVPHPLRLARPGLLPRLMREAGFRSVVVRGVRAPFVYRDADDYVGFNLGVPGPLQDLERSLSRRGRLELRRRLARGVGRYRNGAVLRVPGLAWVVVGRR